MSGKDSASPSSWSESPLSDNPAISSTSLEVELTSLSLHSESPRSPALPTNFDCAIVEIQPANSRKLIISGLGTDSSLENRETVKHSRADIYLLSFTLSTYTPHLKASDPRDKTHRHLVFTKSLTAGSSKTVRDMYVEFAESYICFCRNLACSDGGWGRSSIGGCFNTVRGLLSWVPG